MAWILAKPARGCFGAGASNSASDELKSMIKSMFLKVKEDEILTLLERPGKTKDYLHCQYRKQSYLPKPDSPRETRLKRAILNISTAEARGAVLLTSCRLSARDQVKKKNSQRKIQKKLADKT